MSAIGTNGCDQLSIANFCVYNNHNGSTNKLIFFLKDSSDLLEFPSFSEIESKCAHTAKCL